MSVEYPDYISPVRIPVDTPDAIVDENGKCHFGTFKDPFKKLNLIDCKKPCGRMPDFMKASRITEWEAFEVHMKEGALVSAVYKTASMGFSIFVWFDKRTRKCLSWWNPTIPASKAKIASQLVDDHCYHKTGHSEYEICNDLLNGKAYAKGWSENKKFGRFEIDMEVTRISPPCVVSIPFGENKPLYSEKDFLKAEGTITVGGETYHTDESSVSIIDDHKGYYPFKAHYDWLTTMGELEIDGEMKKFAFNLTRNQSTDQDKYNENLIWLEGVSYPLPPVTFTKESKDAKTWYIKDEHGKVNVRFEIDDVYYIIMHMLVIDSYYALPFGRIYGTVEDTNGKVYKVDGMVGIGEDKTTRM